MKFMDDLFRTGYFLNFSEKLFLYLIKFMTLVFAVIYYFHYAFVIDPTFNKFLFLYFLTFIVSGFFFTLLPLKDEWICALEFFKIQAGLYNADKKLYEIASEKLAVEAKITRDESAEALAGSFASFKSDYFIVYPAWFAVLAMTFVIEAFVFVKLDPLLVQKNFAVLSAFLTLVHVSAMNSTFENFSGLPGSTHSGFSILLVCLFAVRSVFFAILYRNACFQVAIALILTYFFGKLFALLYYGDGFQIFVRTRDRNIWRMAFDARMTRVVECEKLPFTMKCRFLKTPYSTAIAFYESGARVSEFHFTPYRLGVEKESVETAARIFAERLKISDGLKATGSVADLFEEI
ncbi:MAG TPA: hypothetical protein PKK26_03505, partial [Candidatus Wallbacteria bacterium]|nr:hypothetical protein [Candidatus Wallbacteria bacterium]